MNFKGHMILELVLLAFTLMANWSAKNKVQELSLKTGKGSLVSAGKEHPARILAHLGDTLTSSTCTTVPSAHKKLRSFM